MFKKHPTEKKLMLSLSGENSRRQLVLEYQLKTKALQMRKVNLVF